jgi:hypothetical protein
MNNNIPDAVRWWVNIGEEAANEFRSKYYPTQFVITHEQIKDIWEKETKPSYPTDKDIDEAIADISREQMEKFTYSKQRMQPIIEGYKELRDAVSKMCDWHLKQATWDKGDNGYYAGIKALQNAEKLLKEL